MSAVVIVIGGAPEHLAAGEAGPESAEAHMTASQIVVGGAFERLVTAVSNRALRGRE